MKSIEPGRPKIMRWLVVVFDNLLWTEHREDIDVLFTFSFFVARMIVISVFHN